MTFTEWLLATEHGDNPIQDLADDARRDKTWPAELAWSAWERT